MLANQMPTLRRNHDLHARSIERVIQAMSERLHLSMTNEEMANIACFSPCHFNRLFHRVTGIPPVQFYYALRLARAKDLLINTDRCITDICFDVGYNSLGTFISRFNDLVGLSPTAFRRLSRVVASMNLMDFSLILQEVRTATLGDERIVGRIEHPIDFDGLILTALFRRAIPEGRPAGCVLSAQAGPYMLPLPADGCWHVLAVAAPWTTSGHQLLTLNGLWRGHSDAVLVRNGHWSGDSTVRLAFPSIFDPPVLVAIPLLVTKLREFGSSAISDVRLSRVQHSKILQHQ
jgi:AraC family transcriptional regulator